MTPLNGNYIDLIVILVLVYFVSSAWKYGFLLILADFASFLISLITSLRVYKFIAIFFKANFNLSKSFSDALGFLIAAILIETALGKLFYFGISKLPKKIRDNKINKYLGILPALGEGLVFISFLLTLMVSLPVRPIIKKDITTSRIGSYLINKTSTLERSINQVFGGIIDDSLTYFTIKSGSKESVKLDNDIQKLAVDEASETQMFQMVNEERKKRGIEPLVWDPKIVPVARAHAKDMWERHYFSHYSPEGNDVGYRLDTAKIKYSVAGENLAMAPTLQTAHTGLMNSEGHRENILETRFKKVGIGVIDNGIYGKMFVQVFTD
ncbi:MAG: CvpA family protein [Microgenomates group bacterium]